MSGKKAKLARKLNRANAESEFIMKNTIGILDAAPSIPSDMLVTFLVTKFVGRSGYKYVSIGKHGSLFMNDKSADIVPVAYHMTRPLVSVRGRYNDKFRRDIQFLALHVPESFPGIVVDHQANVYIGGSQTPATPEEVLKAITNNGESVEFMKVTAKEFNDALAIEKPLLEAQLKGLETAVKDAAERSKSLIKSANKALDRDNIQDHCAVQLTDVQFDELYAKLCMKLGGLGYAMDDDGKTTKDGKPVELKEFEEAKEKIYLELIHAAGYDVGPVVTTASTTDQPMEIKAAPVNPTEPVCINETKQE